MSRQTSVAIKVPNTGVCQARSAVRLEQVGLPGSMTVTLAVTVTAFLLLFMHLFLQRIRVEALRDELTGMRQHVLDLDEERRERNIS